MTNIEKLDLLLEKVIGLKKDTLEIKTDIGRLNRNDTLILDELDEIERV